MKKKRKVNPNSNYNLTIKRQAKEYGEMSRTGKDWTAYEVFSLLLAVFRGLCYISTDEKRSILTMLKRSHAAVEMIANRVAVRYPRHAVKSFDEGESPWGAVRSKTAFTWVDWWALERMTSPRAYEGSFSWERWAKFCMRTVKECQAEVRREVDKVNAETFYPVSVDDMSIPELHAFAKDMKERLR